MGKQTNQYTKTRTAATTQSDDLLDIDSTEDTGTTFESAKMKVSELLAYINANVNNLYRIDGSLTGSRNVTLDNNTLSFIQGKIRFKSTGGDIPFSLDNSSGVERVKIEYFSTTDSGSLTLSNAAGDFFSASDGFVGVKTSTQSGAEIFNVNGYAKVKNNIGLQGTLASSQGGINTALNGKMIAVNGVTFLWQDSTHGMTMQSLQTAKINFDVGLNERFMEMDGISANMNSLNLFGKITTLTDDINEVEISLSSKFWNGSASTDKLSAITHTITSLPSGASQLDFSIAGTDILTLKDTGVLNASNLPTSSAGLVTGDLWNNSGVLNII